MGLIYVTWCRMSIFTIQSDPVCSVFRAAIVFWGAKDEYQKLDSLPRTWELELSSPMIRMESEKMAALRTRLFCLFSTGCVLFT